MLKREAQQHTGWHKMPNTVPTIDLAAPTFVRVGFSYIDANGTQDSFSLITTAARATAAVVEGAVTSLGAATNASVFEARVEYIFQGSASPLLAIEAPRESAKDVIDTLLRQPSSRMTQNVYIPAPLDALFVPDTNIPDVDNELYDAVDLAFDLLLPADYVPISVRFAEHKNTSQRVKR